MNIDSILNDFENKGYSYLELPQNLFSDLVLLPQIYYSLNIQERNKNIVTINDGILGFTPSEKELESFPFENFKGNKNRGYSSFDFLSDNSSILGTNRLFKSNKWHSNEFREFANHLYHSIQLISEKLCMQILQKLEILKNDIFSRNDTLSIMRLLLYKSRRIEYISKEHTDYEFISFIISEEEGLEIKDKNKEWIKVPLRQNTALLLVGDMLEAISNGKYKSSMHRVKNANIDRTSTIFFQGLPLDYRVQYKTEIINLDNTFGGHILPLLLSGALHLQDNKEEIAKELNIEMTYSNPFKAYK